MEYDIQKTLKVLRICASDKRMCCVGCDYENERMCREIVMHDAANAIEALQAEVERLEPKRGEWLQYMPEYGDMWRCSNCHTYVRLPFRTNKMPYDFCPACGADMRQMEVQE